MAKKLVGLKLANFVNKDFTISNLNDRLQTMLADIDVRAENRENNEWFDELMGYMKNIVVAQETSQFVQTGILSKIYELWEAGKLSTEITTPHSGDFYKFVATIGFFDGGTSKTNIQNKIRTYEYFQNNLNKEGGFYLPEELNKEVVDEVTGEKTYVTITPKIDTANQGKRNLVLGYAKKNGDTLPEDLLISFVDDTVSVVNFKSILDQHKAELKEETSNNNGHTNLKVNTPQSLIPDDEEFVPTKIEIQESSAELSINNGVWFYKNHNIISPILIPADVEAANINHSKEGQKLVAERFDLDNADFNYIPDNVALDSPPVIQRGEDLFLINFNGYVLAQYTKEQLLSLLRGGAKALQLSIVDSECNEV